MNPLSPDNDPTEYVLLFLFTLQKRTQRQKGHVTLPGHRVHTWELAAELSNHPLSGSCYMLMCVHPQGFWGLPSTQLPFCPWRFPMFSQVAVTDFHSFPSVQGKDQGSFLEQSDLTKYLCGNQQLM